MSRSEFFTKAAQRWADELDDQNLTEAIDEALDRLDPDPSNDTSMFVRHATARTLAAQQDSERPDFSDLQ